MKFEERTRLELALMALIDGDNYEADRMLLKAVEVVRAWPVEDDEAERREQTLRYARRAGLRPDQIR